MKGINPKILNTLLECISLCHRIIDTQKENLQIIPVLGSYFIFH